MCLFWFFFFFFFFHATHTNRLLVSTFALSHACFFFYFFLINGYMLTWLWRPSPWIVTAWREKWRSGSGHSYDRIGFWLITRRSICNGVQCPLWPSSWSTGVYRSSSLLFLIALPVKRNEFARAYTWSSANSGIWLVRENQDFWSRNVSLLSLNVNWRRIEGG